MNSQEPVESTSEDHLAIGHDYREQLQSRAAQDKENPYGLLAYPGLTKLLVMANFPEIKASLKASIPELTEEQIYDVINKLVTSQSKNSKYDSPVGHAIVEELALQIEEEAKRQGIDLRSGVSYGIEYIREAVAQTSPLIGYDTTSVLLITAGFIDFCHVLAKLLASTFPAVQDGDRIAVSHDPEAVRQKLIEQPHLAAAWRNLFVGQQVNVSPLIENPLHPLEVPSYLMLLSAMESFAVAHEYGHHICRHSLNGVATADGISTENSFAHEFEADRLAVRITNGIFSGTGNIYGQYGLGAIIFLVVRDIASRGKSLATTGTLGPESDGEHPPIQERIDAIITEVKQRLTIDDSTYFMILIKNVIESLTLLQEVFLSSIAANEGAKNGFRS